MTISKIQVKASYCFGDKPLELNDLGKVNFIFAANGSGKTTISAALAGQPTDPTERSSWNVADTDLTIRVFNEEYRSHVLTEHVAGIFTIGRQSKEVNDKIERLSAEIRNRRDDQDQWEMEIGSSADSQDKKSLEGTIAHLRSETVDAVWAAKLSIPKQTQTEVFRGFQRSKDEFLKQAVTLFSQEKSSENLSNWEALSKIAETLQSDAVQRHPLPTVSTPPLITEQEARFLAASTDQPGGGDFSTLIRKLNNEDWVSQGRDYLDGAEGACPFCQQVQPADLETLLADYFAHGFDAALTKATTISSDVQERAALLTSEVEGLKQALSQDPDIDQTPLSAAIASATQARDLLLSKVSEKQLHPTRSIDPPDIQASFDNLASIIEDENTRISEHNDLVANTKAAKTQLVEDGWRLFLADPTVSVAIKKLQNVATKKQSEIKELRTKIAESIEANTNAHHEIAELQKSISNTTDVADRINKLLKEMGFHRFRLAVESSISGGYRIVR